MDLKELDPEQHAALALFVERLRERLRGISEPAIRQAKLEEAIRRLGPQRAVYLLFELYRRTAWGHYEYKEFFHGFLDLPEIAKRLGVAFMGDMYRQSRECENSLVSTLLVAPPNPLDFPGETAPELRSITLGERRQWAKEFQPKRLEMLMKDFDPIVIRGLLSNPKVLEAHVLKLTSQRPCPASILTEVARHPRWGHRQVIRQAILNNPYVPFRVALPLLPLMNQEELRFLRGQPGLAETLRNATDEIRRLKEIHFSASPLEPIAS